MEIDIYNRIPNTSEYYKYLYIGEKMEPFKLLIDTGSSWSWIKNEKCESVGNCKENDYINNIVPLSHQKLEYFIQIDYKNGYVRGLPI